MSILRALLLQMQIEILLRDPVWRPVRFGVDLVSAWETATVDQVAHGARRNLEDLGDLVDG